MKFVFCLEVVAKVVFLNWSPAEQQHLNNNRWDILQRKHKPLHSDQHVRGETGWEPPEAVRAPQQLHLPAVSPYWLVQVKHKRNWGRLCKSVLEPDQYRIFKTDTNNWIFKNLIYRPIFFSFWADKTKISLAFLISSYSWVLTKVMWQSCGFTFCPTLLKSAGCCVHCISNICCQ